MTIKAVASPAATVMVVMARAEAKSELAHFSKIKFLDLEVAYANAQER
ncbi:hypothetical protein ACFYYL_33760 [Actinomadura geliboluensis]